MNFCVLFCILIVLYYVYFYISIIFNIAFNLSFTITVSSMTFFSFPHPFCYSHNYGLLKVFIEPNFSSVYFWSSLVSAQISILSISWSDHHFNSPSRVLFLYAHFIGWKKFEFHRDNSYLCVQWCCLWLSCEKNINNNSLLFWNVCACGHDPFKLQRTTAECCIVTREMKKEEVMTRGFLSFYCSS